MKNAILALLIFTAFNGIAQIACNPIFNYDGSTYCSNEGFIIPNQDIDDNGIFAYTSENGETLALDSLSGIVDLAISESGEYEITKTVTTDSCMLSYSNYLEVIADITPPVIEMDDFTVSTNPWNCLGDFSIETPVITDDSLLLIEYVISGPTDVTLLAPNSQENTTEYYQVYGLALGDHSFIVIASDHCGNVTEHEFIVTVMKQTLNVIAGTTGKVWLQNDDHIAQVYASDQGEVNTPCAIGKVEIRRETDECNIIGNTTFNNDGQIHDAADDPDNGAFISVCLNDINDIDDEGMEYGRVPFLIRGWTDTNSSGVLNDSIDINGDGDVVDPGEYDNFGDVWGTIEVRKHPLYNSFTCPDDITINCDQDFTDQDITGAVIIPDSIDQDAVSVVYTPNLDACSEGSVEASFYFEEILTCTQTITIENPFPPFDPTSIIMPNDTIYTDCALWEAEPPTWTGGPCDFIGYTEDIDTFDFVSTSSFKLLRRFTVIDWCVYDTTDGMEGLFFGEQEITVSDEKAPTPFCFNLSGYNADEFPLTITASQFNAGAFDNCTPTEDIRFTFSDTDPEFDPEFDPSINSSTRIIELDDLIDGNINLDVYHWDLAGNSDFCIVLVGIFTNTLDLTQAPIKLSISHPNPFIESTTIEFETTRNSEITFSVFDIHGKEHFSTTKTYGKGKHQQKINLTDAPSGILFYRLYTNGSSSVGKMIKI